jgi:hypothetical protein
MNAPSGAGRIQVVLHPTSRTSVQEVDVAGFNPAIAAAQEGLNLDKTTSLQEDELGRLTQPYSRGKTNQSRQMQTESLTEGRQAIGK